MTGSQVERIIDLALEEDMGAGDLTTEALVPETVVGRGSLVAQAEGRVAGVGVARRVFVKIDPALEVEVRVDDGGRVGAGDVIAVVYGRISSILNGERTALNFLQHLSGVATETSKYVAAVEGLPCLIVDTRKTMPGLRLLEKHAVRMGGAGNHRLHLGDGILIKDNHLTSWRSRGLSLKSVVAAARCRAHHLLKVEIEVTAPEEAGEAATAGADAILLDNMSVKDMARAVRLVAGRALVEASGGITLDTVRSVAETGVNLISVGAITHSVKALNISLELEQ
ncbi:MAG: carboxylating nicotinate-nucleotide diphosphorylase [Chloroflexota bacterium]